MIIDKSLCKNSYFFFMVFYVVWKFIGGWCVNWWWYFSCKYKVLLFVFCFMIVNISICFIDRCVLVLKELMLIDYDIWINFEYY